MQIDLDPDVITQYLEIAGVIGSGLVAFGAAWWRFSKWVHSLDGDRERANEQLLKMSESLLKLTEAITVVSVKLDEREEDTIKLEGAMDAQRKDLMSLVAALQKTSSSLDALWRTMQVTHADQVPTRLSDKR